MSGDPWPTKTGKPCVLSVILVGLVGIIVLVAPLNLSHARDGSPTHSLSQSTSPDFQMQIEPNQFLMRTGTSSTPSLVFTPMYGFAGNVTLTATISPEMSPGPTIGSIPSSVKLNASIPGSPAYFIGINSTTATAIGLYTITVKGVSGPIIHSSSATFGVTNAFVPGNSAELVYVGSFTGTAYSGSSAEVNSTFEDLGYVGIGISMITISTTFGTFQKNYGTNLPLSLHPYQEMSDTLSIQIPASTSPGNYQLTATISWVLQPGIFMQSEPDLVTHGNVTVYSSPNVSTHAPAILFSPVLLGALGVAGAIAVATVLAFVLAERGRKKSVASLTSLGPSQAEGQMRTCPNCGSTVLGGKFCPNCGQQLS